MRPLPLLCVPAQFAGSFPLWRALISCAIQCHHIINAFILGTVEDQMYMQQPDGYDDTPTERLVGINKPKRQSRWPSTLNSAVGFTFGARIQRTRPVEPKSPK